MKIFAYVLFAVLVALWLAGFLAFAFYVDAMKSSPDTDTDAIVVLTGGSERVAVAAELFHKDKAKKLFISGVGTKSELKAMTGTHVLSDAKKMAVKLGKNASNTRENALETAEWAKAENIKSLRLVTAYYHMPRSYFEFTRVMPDITIVPDAVFPKNLRENILKDLKWQFVEYNKFIAALILAKTEVLKECFIYVRQFLPFS